VKVALSSLLPSTLEWDPHLAGHLFTILDVTMSPDLRLATVILGCLVKKDLSEKQMLLYLKGLVPKIRKGLASAVSLKYVPDVRFYFEDQEKASLEGILQSIRLKDVDTDQ
jgi:ribosome-binding factor A